MTYKELRIELHKNYYCEATLNTIANNIASILGHVDDFTVNSAASQIELHLNTGSPSELDFNYAIVQAISDYASSVGLECDTWINMYNILISHVEGNKSTVIIML